MVTAILELLSYFLNIKHRYSNVCTDSIEFCNNLLHLHINF